ncbi:TIGR02444 family protein [Marinagarivorans algicola]|uniref:TIGR02444 family protein n=1 Tax=Marinagarivorans algicola TaxID=1513270 RepID=UPI0006B68927|nr:TIGR02444 family protein [Marinagarivorans algicola]
MKLWPFCERFYSRKPVEALCLQLQDNHNICVGLVIWLCWHAAYGRFLNEATFAIAKREFLGADHGMIEQLRSVRKILKSSALADGAAIKSHILAAEILLEKAILERLESYIQLQELTPDSAAFGLLDYLRQHQVPEADRSAQFLYANALACITQ